MVLNSIAKNCKPRDCFDQIKKVITVHDQMFNLFRVVPYMFVSMKNVEKRLE